MDAKWRYLFHKKVEGKALQDTWIFNSGQLTLIYKRLRTAFDWDQELFISHSSISFSIEHLRQGSTLDSTQHYTGGRDQSQCNGLPELLIAEHGFTEHFEKAWW